MTLADRVKLKRTELGLTQTELASRVGITQQSLQKIEDGRTQNPRKLLYLSKMLNCDPEWLQFGTINEVRENNPDYNFKGQKHINLRPVLSHEQALKLPISSSEEHYTEWLYSPPNVSKSSFWLHVIGDSMTSPSGVSIPEGYQILIEPDLIAKSGDLVVAKVNNNEETTFKKLVLDTGKTYLKPLNPDYRATEVTMDFHIIGVVIESRSSFKP